VPDSSVVAAVALVAQVRERDARPRIRSNSLLAGRSRYPCDPRCEECTICAAVAPDAVFSIRTHGTRQLYGPGLVRHIRYPIARNRLVKATGSPKPHDREPTQVRQVADIGRKLAGQNGQSGRRKDQLPPYVPDVSDEGG
jgi:hypothetical protein